MTLQQLARKYGTDKYEHGYKVIDMLKDKMNSTLCSEPIENKELHIYTEIAFIRKSL